MRRLVVSSVEIVCDMFSEKWIHLGFPCQHQYLRGNSITPLAHFSLTSLLHFLMTFCVFDFVFSYVLLQLMQLFEKKNGTQDSSMKKMCGDKMCEVSLLYLDDWCLADGGAL